MIDRLSTVVVGRIRTVAVPDTLDLADRGAKEVSRFEPGALLGPEAGHNSGAEDRPGGQLQAHGSARGGKLRPAEASIVPGGRKGEVREAKRVKLSQVCARCGCK